MRGRLVGGRGWRRERGRRRREGVTRVRWDGGRAGVGIVEVGGALLSCVVMNVPPT